MRTPGSLSAIAKRQIAAGALGNCVAAGDRWVLTGGQDGTAKLLRAAQNDKRLLVRVTVEMLLRTGLRVSEYTSLRADAVVHIGAGPWLHVPVGKLREDRYLPLHPHLVALIYGYRAAHVDPSNPLLLPRENGKPADRHAITRYINRLAPPPGCLIFTLISSGTLWRPRRSTAA